MQISDHWRNTIKRMIEDDRTDNYILLNLGQDRDFLADNGLDYSNPPLKELSRYIKDLRREIFRAT